MCLILEYTAQIFYGVSQSPIGRILGPGIVFVVIPSIIFLVKAVEAGEGLEKQKAANRIKIKKAKRISLFLVVSSLASTGLYELAIGSLTEISTCQRKVPDCFSSLLFLLFGIAAFSTIAVYIWWEQLKSKL